MKDAKSTAPGIGVSNREILAIDDLLSVAVQHGASDIKVTPKDNPLLKINGEWVRLDAAAYSEEQVRNLAKAVLNDKIAKLDEFGSVDTAIDYKDFRYRIIAYSARAGTELVMRVVNHDVPTPREIGLPIDLLELLTKPKGLVLVTGATGSGKSTTLASLIKHVASEPGFKNIITLEDPAEFDLRKFQADSSITQREIGTDSPSFPEAIRDALRSAPDIIVVGEMRDNETIKAALGAAETGHLVLSTLHTNSAADTVTRIIDQFPDKDKNFIATQLASSLLAVVGQKLIKKADDSGRIAAIEYMHVTTGIAHNIRRNNPQAIPSSIQTGGEFGMTMMDDSIFSLLEKGLITQESAIVNALDSRAMAEKIATRSNRRR